jgi:hypothetical protein
MHPNRAADAAIVAGIPKPGRFRVDFPGLSPSERALSPWRLSWPLVVGLLLFVVLLSVEGLPLLADPDTHWHIAIGNWILETGWVPTVDSHSHTFLGQPWIAKEWLSQLLLALAYDAGGWGAVAVLCAASIGLAFALLLRLLLRDIRLLPAALFTIAAIVMTAPHLLARPHVLAFPVMLLWVAGLVRAVEQRRAPKPLLLLAMLLWANLHGGFTLGLMLCGAFALEAVMSARNTAERTSMLPAVRLVITLGLLHLFLKYARNAELLVMLAPLVMAPILARQWPSMRPDRDALAGRTFLERVAALGRPAGRYATLLCISLAAVVAAGMIKFGGIRPPAATTPTAAFDFIHQAKLKGPVFNAYEFGGFLIQAGIPTFIDGRAELFGGDFIKRYADAVNLRGEEPLEQLLDRYKIEWTFLSKDQPANKLLERLPGWRLAYGDDVATVFVRLH